MRMSSFVIAAGHLESGLASLAPAVQVGDLDPKAPMAELEGPPIPMQQQLHGLFQQAMQLLKTEMEILNEKGKPKYIDACDWLSSKMVTMEDRAAHRRLLTNLLDQCGRHLNIDIFSGPFNAYQSSVPYELKTGMPPDERLKHFSLRLWQFGVSEVSHVKGAPPLHGVRDCLQRFLAGTGCETSKFPLEILFEWPNQWQQSPAARPRDPVEDFSLAVSIGSSVTMACHLLCWVAAKLDWLGSEDFLPFDLRKDVAHRLMRCICY